MKKKSKLFDNYKNSLKLCQTKLQKYSPPEAEDKDVSSSIDDADDDVEKSHSYSEFASDRLSNKRLASER